MDVSFVLKIHIARLEQSVFPFSINDLLCNWRHAALFPLVYIIFCALEKWCTSFVSHRCPFYIDI